MGLLALYGHREILVYEFFSESDKTKLAMVLSKIQASDPGPT